MFTAVTDVYIVIVNTVNIVLLLIVAMVNCISDECMKKDYSLQYK